MTGFLTIAEARRREIIATMDALVAELHEIDTAIRVVRRLTANTEPRRETDAQTVTADGPAIPSSAGHEAVESPATVTASDGGSDGGQELPVSGPAATAIGSEDVVSDVRRTSSIPQSEGAPAPAPADETGKSPGAQAPGAPTHREQIVAYLADHPNSTAPEIGAALGIRPNRVRDLCNSHGITIRKLTPDEVVRKAGASPKGPRANTLTSRILACHAEHPDWGGKQIADHLGVKRNSVAGILSIHGIKSGKPDRPREAEAAPELAAERQEAIPATEAPAEPIEPPQRAPEPASAPVPFNADHHVAVQRTRMRPGSKFRLRDRTSGLWLHQALARDGAGRLIMTDVTSYRWEGSEAQLLAVRRKFPETMKLSDEVVDPEPKPQPREEAA